MTNALSARLPLAIGGLMLGFAIGTVGSPNAQASEPAITYKCDKRISQTVKLTEDADFTASTSC